jgi:UDP-GlcNAc:undecaprenyl-phosphate/decaprenyl-phosphate GlcNAc-1-phosphate transferase
MARPLWVLFGAGVLSYAICPFIGRVALRLGIVSQPVNDRWHREPTPLLGGLAIAIATVAAVAALTSWDRTAVVIVSAGAAAHVLGLIDDRVALGATAKLVGSLAIGAAVIYGFRTPGAAAPSAFAILIAVFWFAGIAHAFNLLDNMDGLAAGVGAIAAVALAFTLPPDVGVSVTGVLVALAGALAGFLAWNSHPARIFMGDSGSLFIGAVLGAASLRPWFGHTPDRSWPSLAVFFPFLVPVAEVAFVSALRWLAGRNPVRGGVDHPSHRLVAIGFSPRHAVFVFYAVTSATGAVAVWMARSGTAALPVVGVVVVGLTLGAIHLARVPTYHGDDFVALQRVPYARVLSSAFLRSHAVQVILDLILITACYYAAYRLRFEGEALELFLPSFTASLPIVLLCKPVSHYAAGLYGRSWSTFGVADVPAVSRAVVFGSMASVLAATYLYRFERFSRGVFIIDGVLLLLAILGSRLSFRFIAHAAVMQSTRARRVLICGVGDRGRLLAREMLANAGWHLKPVGFIDATETPERSILGIRVRRPIAHLDTMLKRLRVDELVFSGDPIDAAWRQQVIQICAESGTTVREMVFEIRDAGRPAHGSVA